MEPSPWDDEDLNANDSGAPEPIHLNPSMQDSVIGGDLNTGSIVHNHYHDSEPSVASASQPLGAQQPMIVGQTSNTFGGINSPIQIYQNPSSAPKVIGILVIIYSAISILGEGGGLIMPGGNGVTIALASANILAYAGMVFGGIQMLQYNRQGVFIVLGTILWVAISGVLSLQVVLDYDQMLENGEISQEEYDIITDEGIGGLVSTVGSIAVVICNGICMAIVAIPLMISNNGFEQKKRMV